ncbi:MAG: isocitrate lyase/PEP mutase family protein [bacterium]|nr:isocitrate lyase/PEP mutase family protein [bacterium]
MGSKDFMEKDFEVLFQCRHKRPGDVFMNTLKRDGCIIAPGVYNAMGAYIAKEIMLRRKAVSQPCVFNGVYIGGWSISAMNWRRPDMGFHDRTMMSLMARYAVSSAYPLPTIVDAETGFGTEVTLPELVELYHQMGVGLAHMEDQDSEATRRCGNLGGKQCIAPEKMVAKIRSWLNVSKALGTSMRLMVRTDALTAVGGGIDNALDRAKRYMDVDYRGLRPTVLWADAMIGKKQIERWVSEMLKHDPKMILGINYSPNKDWVSYYRKNHNCLPPTFNELRDLGFKVIWHTILQARIDMEATWRGFVQMAEDGQQVLWDLHERQRNHPVGDSQEMSGAKIWQAYEQFIGGDEAKERYEKSEGYKGEIKK